MIELNTFLPALHGAAKTAHAEVQQGSQTQASYHSKHLVSSWYPLEALHAPR